jgi:hypothetical protein
MDPIQASYIWLAVFFIGVVVFFMGIFRKYSPVKMNPVLGAIVGVLLIVPGFIWGIMPNFPTQPLQQGQTIVVQQPSGTTTTPTTLPPATFTVDPSLSTGAWDVCGGTCVSTAAWNAAETIYTVPLTINYVSASVSRFARNYTAVNFTLTPVAVAGADNTDLATIYFESEYAMKFSGEPVLLADGNDVYFANWSHCESGGQKYRYSGSLSTLFTSSEVLQCVYKLDTTVDDGVAEEMATVGDSVSWAITFHNSDWSWSQTYTILLITVVVN